MKKKTKALISFMLVALIFLNSYGAVNLGLLSTFAEEGIEEPVSGTGWELRTSGELVIKSRVAAGDKGSAPWHEYAKSITSVSITFEPDAIDDYLFEDTNISSIYLPSSVKAISSKAFDGCKNLAIIYYGGDSTQWGRLGLSVNSVTTRFNHNHTEGKLTNIIEANCQNNGYSGDTYCTECNNIITIGKVTPVSHTWSSEKLIKEEATCKDGVGKKAYQCTLCKEWDLSSLEDYKENVSHTWAVAEKSTGSCESGAKYKVVCTECGYTDELESTAHSIKTETVEAKCITDGAEKEICEYCSYEKTIKTIPAIGHDYSVEGREEPDCTNPGKEYLKCSRCDSREWEKVIPANGHTDSSTLGWRVTTKATCIMMGEETQYCTICDKPVVDENGKEITRKISEDFTNHKNPNIDAEYVITKEATCTETGLETYTCKKCNKPVTDETTGEIITRLIEKNPDAHKPVEETVKEATCTEDGLKITTCELCNDKIEREIIPASGHNYKNTNEVSCLDGGTITMECQNCGDQYEKFVEKSAEHDFITEKVNATCTKDGYESKMCKNCTYNETEILEATKHNYEKFTYKKAESCTETGLYANKCTKCGEIVVPTESDPDYDEYIIKATGHKYTTITATEATCTESGFKYDKCDLCGEISNKVYVDKVPHSNTVTITVAPTCTEKGKQKTECSVCHQTTEESIPENGHTYGEIVEVAPTCLKAGYTKHSCKVCGYEEIVEENYKAPIDHELVTVEAKEVTCESEGYSRYQKCKNCDYKSNYELYPALGHNYETIPEKAPTCTEEGNIEYKKCARCGKLSTEENIVIPAKGHTEETIPGKDATCTENGFSESVKCSVCNVILREKTTIEAKGHTLEIIPAVEPSCEEGGHKGLTEGARCSKCNEIIVKQNEIGEIPGHNYVFIKEVEPSCTECGYSIYECSRCGEEKIENEVPVALHQLVLFDEEMVATCNHGGATAYFVCNNCHMANDTDENVKIMQDSTKSEYIGKMVDKKTHEIDKTGIDNFSLEQIKLYKTFPKEPNNHEDIEDIEGKDATCEEDGYTASQFCNACPNHVVEGHEKETIPALGHKCEINYTWSEDNSSCTAIATCSRCDKELESLTVESEYSRVENTCLVDGFKTYTATFDDSSIFENQTKTITIEAPGQHTEVELAYLAPTCTAAGLENGIKCSACDEIIKAQVVIPPLGHTSSDPVKENVVEAKCDAAGSYDDVYYCSVCQDEINRVSEIIPAKEHKFGNPTITKAATAFKKGTMSSYCEFCHKELNVDYSLTFIEKVMWVFNWLFAALDNFLVAINNGLAQFA